MRVAKAYSQVDSQETHEQHACTHPMIKISRLLEDDETHKKFKLFIEQLITKGNTLKFWYQFILMDCLCYLSTWTILVVHNGNQPEILRKTLIEHTQTMP